jgi:hypothetical protein
MKLILFGENPYVRLLLVLGGAMSLNLGLRVIVVHAIPYSPLFLIAYESTYWFTMVAGIVVNHLWVEALAHYGQKSKYQK